MDIQTPPIADGARPVSIDEIDDTDTPLCPDLPPELHYSDDSQPGIRRKLSRGKYIYLAADGKRIRDASEVERINKLAIPPAYRDVWICADPHGHLQATGRDARGRKQYRYHPRWREVRDHGKYQRMLQFGQALPGLRACLERDIGRPGLPREKVMALVIRLLESTLIRVGNARYARDNRSYGLTTLRNRHVSIRGSAIRFSFRGKSGIEHEVTLRDRRLARLMRRCMELPGQHLFQYLDDQGQRHTVSSGDVNDYLRQSTGQSFTAKDYRTWLAARRLWLGCDASRGSQKLRHAERWSRRSGRSHHCWATHQPSAGSAMCTPKSSRLFCAANWPSCAQLAPQVAERRRGGLIHFLQRYASSA